MNKNDIIAENFDQETIEYIRQCRLLQSWEVVHDETHGLWLESQISEFYKNPEVFAEEKFKTTYRYVIKDKERIVAGGNFSIFVNEVLNIEAVFVDINYRRNRLGTILLNKIELEAREVGAKLAHLDTLDIYTRDFYLKRGYEVCDIFETSSGKYKRYHMRKDL